MEQLLHRVSSRELTEWMAYAEIEPFGERRRDLRAALVARTIAEIHRDPEKRKEPFRIDEFMLDFGHDEPADEHKEFGELPVENQLFFLELINTAFGGKDLR